MNILHRLGRIVLAVALSAGSCEDLLPSIGIVECSIPLPSSDGDEEEGGGVGLSHSSLEPILICMLDLALGIQLESRLLQSESPQAPSSVVIDRIPHVPKSPASL